MFDYLITLELAHNGDCYLLGMSSDNTIYVEEVYGSDDRLAQHALTLDGQRLYSVDEDDDHRTNFVPLTLPEDVICPQPGHKAHRLDFSGPRWRGLRESERVGDLVRPFSVPTRITLGQRFDIVPSMLLGIAESRVLAEALLAPPDLYFVCRRIRIAFALLQAQHDANHQPYDYDTIPVYIAHPYRVTSDEFDVAPEVAFAGLPGVELMRPMDCLSVNDLLCIADGGHDTRNSRIHLWKIVE